MGFLKFMIVLLHVVLLTNSSTESDSKTAQQQLHELQEFKNLAGPGSCVVFNCTKPLLACLVDTQCREAAICNTKCASQTNEQACNLLCELTYGYNSTLYRSFLQCLSDHDCLPVSLPDGKCLAGDSDAIKNLTNLSQVKGKWWILRGLNCGQKGWPAGFDFFPCQRDEFVLEGNQWVDHIAYCGGKNNTCSTPLIYTVANVSIRKPGVMTHYYTDPPLRPQNEEWTVLSWPHPDWMLYIYCGYTPTGPYAGGSVVTRLDKPRMNEIPAYVEAQFKATAHRFGFDYDAMCLSNVTMCQD